MLSCQFCLSVVFTQTSGVPWEDVRCFEVESEVGVLFFSDIAKIVKISFVFFLCLSFSFSSICVFIRKLFYYLKEFFIPVFCIICPKYCFMSCLSLCETCWFCICNTCITLRYRTREGLGQIMLGTVRTWKETLHQRRQITRLIWAYIYIFSVWLMYIALISATVCA